MSDKKVRLDLRVHDKVCNLYWFNRYLETHLQQNDLMKTTVQRKLTSYSASKKPSKKLNNYSQLMMKQHEYLQGGSGVVSRN